MRMAADTFVTPSGYVCGVVHVKTRVCAGSTATVLVPVSPGYVSGGLVPGTVTPARFTPSRSRMLTATLAVEAAPLKMWISALALLPAFWKVTGVQTQMYGGPAAADPAGPCGPVGPVGPAMFHCTRDSLA